jgi:transposase-like protein
MLKPRPALFKWRYFEPEIIICAVRWYLRFSLSYRDVEELLMERGLPADHTTIWRWVQRYAPELNKRCRRELKPTNGSCPPAPVVDLFQRGDQQFMVEERLENP